MTKLSNLLRNRLKAALDRRGAVAEFVRKVGVSRTGVENWLAGKSSPNIENLESIAEALGVQPWELIKPEGALPTPAPESPAVEPLLEAVRRLEARVRELEKSPSHPLVKDKPVAIDEAESDARALLGQIVESGGDDLVEKLARMARSFMRSADKAKRGSSSKAG